ncbi:MAG: DUF6569 family protein [bacterium]
MKDEIIDLLEDLKIAEPISYKELTVFPILNKSKSNVSYVSPEELLKNSLIEITEIDKGGSVPELLLKNNSEHKVFFWDGIELIGAKQNRVLNVSILVDKQTNVIIPVSCVEQSRWSYNSNKFSMSDFAMPNRMRTNKRQSVDFSMRAGMGARSDQRKVWEDVEQYKMELNVESPTNAMNDIMMKINSDLENYNNKIKSIPGQIGMIVAINGRIIGMEYVSNEDVFKKLYDKILKSYTTDCIMNNPLNDFKSTEYEGNTQEFLNNLRDMEIDKFKAVGLGKDLRFKNRNISGSGIVYRKNIISLSVSTQS